MSLTEVIVQGTLKADGSLELDQPVSLDPGRVQVIVQPLPAAPQPRQELTAVIDQIRQGQQARGFQGRSAAEIEAQRREGEAEYEQRMQTIHLPANSGSSAGAS